MHLTPMLRRDLSVNLLHHLGRYKEVQKIHKPEEMRLKVPNLLLQISRLEVISA